MTADGETLTASDEENPDLFWGIRGGGGNFGVVTEFEFRLNPVGPKVLAGPIFWRMEESPDVLRFYRDWVAEAPAELMTAVIHRKAPPLPFIPAELHGEPVVAVVCCYPGPIEDGRARREAAPGLRLTRSRRLRRRSPSSSTRRCSTPPSRTGGGTDARLRRGRAQRRGDRHRRRALGAISSPLTSWPIWNLGGAMTRVSEDETAFQGRDPHFEFNITAATAGEEGFDAEREWVRSFWSALEPQRAGVYVNFLMDEGVRPGPRRVRRREVRAAEGAEAEVRPGQRLPPQPEHPAGLGEVTQPQLAARDVRTPRGGPSRMPPNRGAADGSTARPGRSTGPVRGNRLEAVLAQGGEVDRQIDGVEETLGERCASCEHGGRG